MIRGTYVFYQDGKEIYRSSNVITKFGKRFLTNFIAGNIADANKDMAFGVDRKEALVTAASASTGTITYTANNYFSTGDIVSIYGLSTSAFNLTNVTVASASTTQFTVTNAATGTAVSGSTSGRAFKKATDGDTRLGFEFYRLPIQLASTDIQTSGAVTTYSVVYKTTLPQDVSATISEIGLYPSSRSSVNNFDSKYLADFNDAFDWTDENGDHPPVATIGQKIGDNVIVLESNGTSAMEYTQDVNPIDLSGYSVNDSIIFAYDKPEADVSSIKIRFYSETTKYYEVTITPQTGLGYKIAPDILMSTVFAGAVNSPDKTNINKIGIIITPTSSNTTSIGADGLRINDEDTFDPIFGMISRSTLATPLEKIKGRPIDVEYILDLSF
jgi:hypothetical protein